MLLTELSGAPSLREVMRRWHQVVLDAHRDVEIPTMALFDPRDDGPLARAALKYVPEAEPRY